MWEAERQPKILFGGSRCDGKDQSCRHIRMRDGGGRVWGPDEMSGVSNTPGKGSGPFSSDLEDGASSRYQALS